MKEEKTPGVLGTTTIRLNEYTIQGDLVPQDDYYDLREALKLGKQTLVSVRTYNRKTRKLNRELLINTAAVVLLEPFVAEE